MRFTAIHFQCSIRPLRIIVGALTAAFVGLTAGCSKDDDPTVPEAPLTVELRSPSEGAEVVGLIGLEAVSNGAERVTFAVDGTEIVTDTSGPTFFFSWNSTSVENGSHLIEATAFSGSESVTDAANVLVANPGGGVTVGVSPSAVTLEVNQTQQFTATVVGNANTAVTWSIDQGATHGSISSTGLYTAPTALPVSTSATIRATSTADPTQSGAAIVTLTGDGGGPLPPDEVPLLSFTYFAGFRVLQTIDDTNEFAARAFFGASCLNGNQPTTTGTLTQAQNGDFTYAGSPNNLLRVVLIGGTMFDIVYVTVEGNLGEFRCDDYISFLTAHGDFRYQVSTTGSSITVSSAFTPSGEFQSQVAQTLAGTITVGTTAWTVNASVEGTHEFLPFEGGSTRRDQSVVTGVLTTGDLRIEVTQQHFYENNFSSGSGTLIESRDDVQNQGSRGGTALVFQLQEVIARYASSGGEGVYQLEGNVLRNGSQLGTMVIEPRSGAVGVRLNGGAIVPL